MLLTSTLGLANPLRYRGYCYDDETGLYYLNSRYYNPTWCRFISEDIAEIQLAAGNTVSGNLYAYCDNSPTKYSDPLGFFKMNRTWYGYTISFSEKEAQSILIAAGVGTAGAGTVKAISAVLKKLGLSTVFEAPEFALFLTLIAAHLSVITAIEHFGKHRGFSIKVVTWPVFMYWYWGN